MHYNYLQDKDMRLKLMVWEMMEQYQENNRFVHFGWYGFVIMVFDDCYFYLSQI